MSNKADRLKHNLQKSHEASEASRYSQDGLNYKRHKFSSKNFDKLMEQRGLSHEEISSLKASMEKGQQMEVRHARKREKFTTTHGFKRSSGVFVSEKSLGATPEERIDKGANYSHGQTI